MVVPQLASLKSTQAPKGIGAKPKRRYTKRVKASGANKQKRKTTRGKKSVTSCTEKPSKAVSQEAFEEGELEAETDSGEENEEDEDFSNELSQKVSQTLSQGQEYFIEPISCRTKGAMQRQDAVQKRYALVKSPA